MMVLGVVALVLGAWLFFLIPFFGGSFYGNGYSEGAFYMAYAQAALPLAAGFALSALGTVGWWQRRCGTTAEVWPTARGRVRLVALVLTGVGALAVVLGLAVTVLDPTSTDYWLFGIPVALLWSGSGFIAWFASSDAAERPTWSPPEQ